MKNKMHQRVRHRGRLEHIVRGLFTSGVKILNKLFPRPNPRIKDTFEGKWTLNTTNTLRLPLSRIPGVEMCVFKARPGVADGELGPKMALRPNFQWGSSHFGHSLSPEVRGGEKKKQTNQTVNPKPIQPPTSPASLFRMMTAHISFPCFPFRSALWSVYVSVITHRFDTAHIRYSHRFMHSQINPTVTTRAESLLH